VVSRIEDTDRERSTKEAIAAILDGLAWLGIEWDGDVVYQFSRAARHREVAEQLLATGQAYRCYASQQELDEMRERARREGRAKLYDGRWRDRDPAEPPAGGGREGVGWAGGGRGCRRGAWGGQAGDPPASAAFRRDRDRGSGPGPRRMAEREPRRPRAAAFRRHAHIHAGGGGRRPRYGRHSHYTGRRSPHQRGAANADLQWGRLAGAADGALPRYPRARRVQAFQAPRRTWRRCLPGHGLSAGGAAQLSGTAGLEPRRPGDLFDHGNGPGFRPAADRPLSSALRLCQTR